MTFDRPRLTILLLILPLLAGQAIGAVTERAVDKAPRRAPKRTRPPAPVPAPAAAPNCDLSAPPLEAGIDSSMGQLVRVFPRNSDIGPAYAGCQTLWAGDGQAWSVITVAHYVAGHVARIESPQEAHDPMAECRVEAGQVVRGDPTLCEQLDEIRFESLPAACLGEPGSAPTSPSQACERR
jgi:hypothetical protein